MVSRNKWKNSCIYTNGLMIPTKVGTLSITKCKGFSFLVHVWANYKFMSSKCWKINKWQVGIRAGGEEKSQKLIIGGWTTVR